MRDIPFEVVGFDLDGTLLDTSGDLAAAVNYAIAQDGLPAFPADAIRPFVGRGARVMLDHALSAGGGAKPGQVDRLLPILLDYYEQNLAIHTIPYPGLIPAMEALRARGIRLAVCTNKIERFAVPLLHQLGLSDYFACVVGGDTVGIAKPDPAPLHAMVERAGGGRAIFLGDTVNDIKGARNAALPNIAVRFGFDSAVEDLGADAILEHFDDLVPMLEGWKN